MEQTIRARKAARTPLSVISQARPRIGLPVHPADTSANRLFFVRQNVAPTPVADMAEATASPPAPARSKEARWSETEGRGLGSLLVGGLLLLLAAAAFAPGQLYRLPLPAALVGFLTDPPAESMPLDAGVRYADPAPLLADTEGPLLAEVISRMVAEEGGASAAWAAAADEEEEGKATGAAAEADILTGGPTWEVERPGNDREDAEGKGLLSQAAAEGPAESAQLLAVLGAAAKWLGVQGLGAGELVLAAQAAGALASALLLLLG